MEKMDPVLVIFEKWASSKGFALTRRADAKAPYQFLYEDPITPAAWEGYCKGGTDSSTFWQPRFAAAISIVGKKGLNEDYEEELVKMEELLKAGYANAQRQSHD
jgi:hypothetical protein